MIDKLNVLRLFTSLNVLRLGIFCNPKFYAFPFNQRQAATTFLQELQFPSAQKSMQVLATLNHP